MFSSDQIGPDTSSRLNVAAALAFPGSPMTGVGSPRRRSQPLTGARW
jgi:hypothetical protein